MWTNHFINMLMRSNSHKQHTHTHWHFSDHFIPFRMFVYRAATYTLTHCCSSSSHSCVIINMVADPLHLLFQSHFELFTIFCWRLAFDRNVRTRWVGVEHKSWYNSFMHTHTHKYSIEFSSIESYDLALCEWLVSFVYMMLCCLSNDDDDVEHSVKKSPFRRANMSNVCGFICDFSQFFVQRD